MPSRSRPAGAVKHGLFLDSCRLIGNRFWPSGALARSLKPKACGSTWWEDVANSVDGRDGAGAVDANAAVAIALQRLEPNAPGTRRGWGAGTLSSEVVGGDRFATFATT